MNLHERRFRIGPYKFTLCLDETAREITATTQTRGTCASDMLTIYIDPSLPFARQLATLLHEAFHEFINDAPDIPGGVTAEQVEALLTILERGIVQLIRDEWWLFERLRKELTK